MDSSMSGQNNLYTALKCNCFFHFFTFTFFIFFKHLFLPNTTKPPLSFFSFTWLCLEKTVYFLCNSDYFRMCKILKFKRHITLAFQQRCKEKKRNKLGSGLAQWTCQIRHMYIKGWSWKGHILCLKLTRMMWSKIQMFQVIYKLILQTLTCGRSTNINSNTYNIGVFQSGQKTNFKWNFSSKCWIINPWLLMDFLLLNKLCYHLKTRQKYNIKNKTYTKLKKRITIVSYAYPTVTSMLLH
jgi:hypothetical protein